MARLVYKHKLSQRDPLAFDEHPGAGLVARQLLSAQAVTLDALAD
jgi:hypothetical protein